MATTHHRQHGDERVQSTFYGARALERTMPALRDYLQVGQRILDVGCGPGTITADVAGMVVPGLVTGIDREDGALHKASVLAQERGLTNLSFQTGNVYELKFADDTFDLVYSNAVFTWLNNPLAGLKEMMRVTKPGGVVVGQAPDFGAIFRFPPSPAWEQWIRALEYFRTVAERDVHGNPYVGRELFGFFVEAGLSDITVSSHASAVFHHGSEQFDYYFELSLLMLDLEGPWGHWSERMIQDGIIEETLLAQARDEMERWHEDPRAFGQSSASVFVAGKVCE
jgi:SAM-dependent methyltransferase